MASSKETHQTSRPLSQHRTSMSNSSLGSSLPKNHSRHHSHSLSSGSLNPNHRVTRRKSISNNNATNVAAVAAALKEAGDATFAIPMPRRHTTSKGASNKLEGINYPSPPSSLPFRNAIRPTDVKPEGGDSAIDDEQNDDDDDDSAFSNLRMRRASEGQHLIKGESKKIIPVDLKCEKCGKGYKHSSCLTKHLWEHTPEWSLTSKLLISKHQQVQLLEAASVLVAMNQDADTPPDSAKDFPSDHDSASPSASGSSGHRDGQSSTDTTPPPQADVQSSSYVSTRPVRPKRYRRGSSFSRSYQSAPSSALKIGSAPNGAFGHYRHTSHDGRPVSSGISTGGEEDEAGLAAAVELLSCSFGTPRSGPVTLPADVPPVPPLPAQYLSQSNYSNHTLTPTHHSFRPTESYTRHQVREKADVKMEDSGGESNIDEDEDEDTYKGRSDEDDDGVFGRMEE